MVVSYVPEHAITDLQTEVVIIAKIGLHMINAQDADID